MPTVFAKLLAKLGFPASHGAKEPETAAPSPAEQYAQPRVEHGSTLETMVALSPATASTYTEAIIDQLANCIATCTIGRPDIPEAQALEQIHALKNAIAPTGSVELLAACESLRVDACRRTSPPTLEQRFKAIANATMQLVQNYARALPTTPTNKGSNDDG